MALADKAKQAALQAGNMQGAPQGEPLSEGEELDADIASGLISVAIMEKGMQAINEAVSQSNPVPILASIISSLVKEIAPRLEESGLQVSPRAYLADGGAVDRVISLISDMSGGLDETTQNAVFAEVVDQLKIIAKTGGQQGQQQMPPGQGPQGLPQPQGGEGMGPGAPGMPPAPMGGAV